MSLSFSHAHSQGSGTTEVVAVLIAITNNVARVLTVDNGKLLPNGPLTPLHRSLQSGVRQWVEEQTQQPLGYIEQLYTFVDTNRRNKEGHALVYVSYMGLVQESDLDNNRQKPDISDQLSRKNVHHKVVDTNSPTNKNNYKSNDKNANKQLNTNASNSYLNQALDKKRPMSDTNQASWRDWYEFFPWENQKNKNAKKNSLFIIAKLIDWAKRADKEEKYRRMQRICLCWGGIWSIEDLNQNQPDIGSEALVNTANNNTENYAKNNAKNNANVATYIQQELSAFLSPDKGQTNEMYTEWVAEHALLRYEMLYEAGLLPESPDYQPTKLPANWQIITGEPMYYDHRRVIATAISRLRAKIEYRPLIFGLMPPEFTLLQLQQSVEALSGVPMHKQNFRRLLESQNLLEPTGHSSHIGRGRPAKLYRFRFDVELQSLLMDSKLPKRQFR